MRRPLLKANGSLITKLSKWERFYIYIYILVALKRDPEEIF